MDFGEETLLFVMDGLSDGEKAAWTVATGGEPDLERLDRYAKALDVLRQGNTKGTLDAGWLQPTEEDVRAAQHLAQLVREGAPREALVEPARRAYAATANPNALSWLSYVLPWLAGEARRIASGEGPPKPDRVTEMLDAAAAFCERGGNVAGFVPTPEDLAHVRRLRELVTATSKEELAERHRLAKELWACLPQDNVSEGVRRMVADDEKEPMLDTGEPVCHLVGDGLVEGGKAAWAVANGGAPDLERLDRFVQAMELLPQEIAEGRWTGWVNPTEENMRAVRHLAQLVREGAPREALVEPALRAYAVTANPSAMSRLADHLPWLAGEATRRAYSRGAPDLDEAREWLDLAAAYFERGGDVSGFVPTPEDLARVRRLRELVTVESDEELLERQRLAKALWARLPQDYTARVQRDLTAEE